MLAPVETAFRAALATVPTVASWPRRWPNEPWPDGTPLSDGGLPVDGAGRPAPCLEAEIIADRAVVVALAAGADGRTAMRRSGLLRLYLIVPAGDGLSLITAADDALEAALAARTLLSDPAAGARLLTAGAGPPLTYDHPGGRFVRMISIHFDHHFRA